jgi:hypothetical protein
LGSAAGAADDEDDGEDGGDGATLEELTGTAVAASDAAVAGAESPESAVAFAVVLPTDDAFAAVFASVVADPPS